MSTKNTPHADDLNTALLVAAQNLAQVAIDRNGPEEVERVGQAYDRGAHLQVSVELPSLRLTVMLVERDNASSRMIYNAAPDPLTSPVSPRLPASRLN